MATKKTSCSKGIWTIRCIVVVINLVILFKHDILPFSVLPSIAGFATALFAGLFVGPLAKWSISGWDAQVPKRKDGGNSVELLSKSKDIPGPFILGILEVSVFYASLLVEAWAIIGGWFLFKAASKWAAWQHIMRVPESIAELDDISYLRYRYKKTSSLLSSFLVGTLSNVGAAFVGLLINRILATY